MLWENVELSLQNYKIFVFCWSTYSHLLFDFDWWHNRSGMSITKFHILNHANKTEKNDTI